MLHFNYMEKYREIIKNNPEIRKVLDEKLADQKLEQKADLLLADLETYLNDIKRVIAKYPGKIKKKELKAMFQDVIKGL